MLNFKEFYKEQENTLVELWGKLVYQPISAEEFAHCVAKQCFEQYNKGAIDALKITEERSEKSCASRRYPDGDEAFDAVWTITDEVRKEVERNQENAENKN